MMIIHSGSLINQILVNKKASGKIVAEVSLVFFGVLFLALMAQLKIILPFTVVPITGQTFAVLLIGAIYGLKRGVLTGGLYLFLGTIGLPFFAGGAAGALYLTGPTGGYLIGFLVAILVMGIIVEKTEMERSIKSSWILFIIGEFIIFSFGLIWLSQFIGFKKAFYAGFFPFIPGETIKIIIASSLLPIFWKRVKSN